MPSNIPLIWSLGLGKLWLAGLKGMERSVSRMLLPIVSLFTELCHNRNHQRKPERKGDCFYIAFFRSRALREQIIRPVQLGL